MNLKDKVVVVSGATGGIGSEVAKEFSEKGARLILIARNEDKLTHLKDEMYGEGHEVIGFDSTRTSEVCYIKRKVSGLTNHIEVLINAAGVGVYKNIEDVDLREWEDSFAINVTTPYFLTKELLPELKKSEKSVVLNVGSRMGKTPTPCRSVYCATKYALRGLSLSLAAEFHNSSVHFVHIALGSTFTEFGPMSLEEKKGENLKGKSYFTPIWVAKKFVTIVENEEFDPEIILYPSEYK